MDFYSQLLESVLSYGWYNSDIRRRGMGRGMGTTVWTGLKEDRRDSDFRMVSDIIIEPKEFMSAGIKVD